MKKIKSLLAILTTILLSCAHNTNAQINTKTSNALDKKQQAIVTIPAFTAQGNITKLQKALNEGLNAGLTINEVKEILVQLYAYAGFPRNLNALNNFMTVLNERKQKGVNDILGKTPNPIPNDKSKIEFGTAVQTQFVGRPVSGEVFAFAPAIDTFLKEHLFGDIFGRNNLTWKTRELATVSALAAMDGAGNQLRSHFGVSMYNGLSKEQLIHVVSIIQTDVGIKEGNAAKEVLQSVLKQNQSNTTTNSNKLNVEKNSAVLTNEALLFSKGNKITNNNFIGDTWLQILVPNDSTYQT